MDLHSGYPFSLIRYGLCYPYPQLEKSIKTNVVIVGGGISGALAAYHLVTAGIECVVVDGRTIGLGSTCASTSLLQYEIDVPLKDLIAKVGEQHAVRSYELCKESIDRLKSIAKDISFENFQTRSSLYFASHDKDVSSLSEEYLARKRHGFDVTYLERNEIKNQFNFSSAGAILSKDGAQTDAYQYTHALYQHALKKGLQVYDRTLVKKVSTTKNGVLVKTNSGHTIEANKLIYATGYETTEFVSKKIVNLKSTFVTVSESMGAAFDEWDKQSVLWNTANPYL